MVNKTGGKFPIKGRIRVSKKTKNTVSESKITAKLPMIANKKIIQTDNSNQKNIQTGNSNQKIKLTANRNSRIRIKI